MSATKHIAYTSVLILLCIAFFEITNADVWLQSHFFRAELGRWLLDRNQSILRLLFYDGPKAVLITFTLALTVSLLPWFQRLWGRPQRKRGAWVVLLALVAVPFFVASLKAATNMPCPVDIEIYGGGVPNVRLLERYPEDSKPVNRQRCFPAAHASGGFALMALPLLFLGGRSKRIALACGVSIGWAMGGYKMLIGDHFISHTIVSMLLAWLMLHVIMRLEMYITQQPQLKTLK